MTDFTELSVPVTNDVLADPPPLRPRITYTSHVRAPSRCFLRFPA